MSKKLSSYLKKKLKGYKSWEIIDILLFGSAVKGKEFPRDIDLCVVFKEKISEETIKDMEHKLKEFNVHVSSLTTDNFFKKPHSLIKTILVEGTSIFTGKRLIQNFGFSSYTLYSYDLSKLKLSEKVRFVYLMKGRKETGIVEKLGGEWIADSCFIVPIQKDNEILTILKKWQISFKRKEVLVH